MAQMIFVSLTEFKSTLGVDKIDIVFNPATGKTFGTHAKGTVKVQQDLDSALPMRYMHEVENFSEGCIVNVKPLETKFSL